MIKMKKK